MARLLDGPPAVIAAGGGAFVEAETRALIAAKGILSGCGPIWTCW